MYSGRYSAFKALFNAVLHHPAGKLLGPAVTLINWRWRQAAGESLVGSASALHSIFTYSLCVSPLHKRGWTFRISFSFQLFFTVFSCLRVKVFVFFFFPQCHLPLCSLSCCVGGSRCNWGRLTTMSSRGGWTCSYLTVPSHVATRGAANEGTWRSFWGEGGWGQTVSVSVSPYTFYKFLWIGQTELRHLWWWCSILQEEGWLTEVSKWNDIYDWIQNSTVQNALLKAHCYCLRQLSWSYVRDTSTLSKP